MPAITASGMKTSGITTSLIATAVMARRMLPRALLKLKSPPSTISASGVARRATSFSAVSRNVGNLSPTSDASTPSTPARISGFSAIDFSVLFSGTRSPLVKKASATTARTLYIGTSTALSIEAAAACASPNTLVTRLTPKIT